MMERAGRLALLQPYSVCFYAFPCASAKKEQSRGRLTENASFVDDNWPPRSPGVCRAEKLRPSGGGLLAPRRQLLYLDPAEVDDGIGAVHLEREPAPRVLRVVDVHDHLVVQLD